MRHFCQIRRKRQSGIHDERDVLLMEKEAEVSPVLNFFIRDVTRHAPPPNPKCVAASLITERQKQRILKYFSSDISQSVNVA